MKIWILRYNFFNFPCIRIYQRNILVIRGLYFKQSRNKGKEGKVCAVRNVRVNCTICLHPCGHVASGRRLGPRLKCYRENCGNVCENGVRMARIILFFFRFLCVYLFICDDHAHLRGDRDTHRHRHR